MYLISSYPRIIYSYLDHLGTTGDEVEHYIISLTDTEDESYTGYPNL